MAIRQSGARVRSTQFLASLERKRLDLIVANDVSRDVFGSDANEVTLLFCDGRRQDIPRMSKNAVADRLLDAIAQLLAPAP